ncbi:ACP S-malonyltransferase [Actinophytocola xanthii]|uniref:Malonyl CoA-acyl carrier protein transacylase n=1 Tax=Actinophytocola xanthii TaxID=1912961 RepID=A0A1Q8CKY2_9PSEU|nr:ACP S-malonyltransferase [Actinophytocola xanthii]OLF15013.1 malonate decarboxylase subunit epsilon [Actinophytocola xanthii]
MFPGQGSQRAGMAAHLLARYPDLTRPVFEFADETAGFALTQLCVDGGKQDLTRTDVTQLAVFATSLATWSVLTAHRYRPAAVAGHSLGELTALAAAGVLTIPAAFALVRRRGELMARVAERTSGAMVAVVGLDATTVEKLCADTRVPGVVEVANFNDFRQTVVSGHREAVTDLARACTAAGADKVVQLEVGAPFHCSLMAEIDDEFASALGACSFAPPSIPVISSVTGARLSIGEEAKSSLRRQLAGPVRWVDVLRTADEAGWTRFTEIGPGRVLTGFARSTFPDYPVRSTGDERRIEAVIRNEENEGVSQ